ncbi:MAG: hypothetical protein GX895_00140 [Clostridiales bacterium]|uniref:hypothetical protein n=1 Tax=Clostridium sp. N3C TaxID=1776758 RepID=UPI00092DF73C|nr:hypothetical protein [Clostridium sp. N3C]NLZ47196.1 hypothetical protein [Clostridiales bacterium]SCN25807.1 hypothetical protein N3C_2528 [Clostridium sp. N3C]
MSLPIDKYLAITKEEEVKSNKRRVRVVVKDWHGYFAEKALVKVYVEKEDKSLHLLGEGYTNSKGEIIINGLSKNKSYKLEVIYKGVRENKFIEARNVIEDEYFEDYGYDEVDEEE